MNKREKSSWFSIGNQRADLQAGSAATQLAGANEGTSPASSAPPPGGGNRASSENAPTAGGAGPDQERTAQATDECRDTIQSSPVPRRESKTLQHQVQEIYRLVDGAIESLEQVLRALRTIDKDL
jgi:hypothetical protein